MLYFPAKLIHGTLDTGVAKDLKLGKSLVQSHALSICVHQILGEKCPHFSYRHWLASGWSVPASPAARATCFRRCLIKHHDASLFSSSSGGGRLQAWSEWEMENSTIFRVTLARIQLLASIFHCFVDWFGIAPGHLLRRLSLPIEGHDQWCCIHKVNPEGIEIDLWKWLSKETQVSTLLIASMKTAMDESSRRIIHDCKYLIQAALHRMRIAAKSLIAVSI